MFSSYLLSIETPSPLSLGVGGILRLCHVVSCALGLWLRGNCGSVSFCVGPLLALQALFLLRLRLPFSRKLLWGFRFLGLLLLLPSL